MSSTTLKNSLSPLASHRDQDLHGVFVFDDVLLGKGSQGVVKLGNVGHSFCAVKEGKTDTLLRELATLLLLNSKNCCSAVRLYTYDVQGPRTQLFMELAVNDLLTHINSNFIFDKKQAIDDLVSGMALIHSIGIAHGDIKPENILLTADMRVKYCDWGMSQKLNRNCHAFTGSRNYMSPLKLLCKPFDNCRADWWALGVVFFVILCGTLPFRFACRSDRGFMHFLAHGERLPVRSLLDFYAHDSVDAVISTFDPLLLQKVDEFLETLHFTMLTASTCRD
tara:strand:+ start:3254 stop:4090 length:837 start_codon:yes stop_codon:yes gene_type:complete